MGYRLILLEGVRGSILRNQFGNFIRVSGGLIFTPYQFLSHLPVVTSNPRLELGCALEGIFRVDHPVLSLANGRGAGFHRLFQGFLTMLWRFGIGIFEIVAVFAKLRFRKLLPPRRGVVWVLRVSSVGRPLSDSSTCALVNFSQLVYLHVVLGRV